MEFASSLKALGWFVQMLSDKSLTATIQHSGGIADKPDLYEALESLLDELDWVQAMLSLAQNFGGQNKDLVEFLKNLKDAAYDVDDLLSEVDYYRLEQQVNDSEDMDDRLQKASTSSTPPSTDNNKVTIVQRIREIVSRLKRLVTCLRKDLSLLQPKEGLRANPNVFPVASHPLTTSSLFRNEKRFLPSLDLVNHLRVMAEGEFLAMFNKCIFGGEDSSDHLELDEIAKQIAGKLNGPLQAASLAGRLLRDDLDEHDEIAKQIAGKLSGSLLAASIVGGLLRDDLDEQHWRNVLGSDIWQQRRSADDIMPILRFSYHHLPAHLQQCFAYCGVFPKDWKFEKEDLVGMWISQGYIHTKSGGNLSPEEIGSEYFDHLVSKSFIKSSNERCYLHELLHDLAESILENDCLRINLNGTEGITSRARHIYVGNCKLKIPKSCNLRNLRTLIIDKTVIDDDENVLKEVLNRLKSIRVLCLDYADVGLLSRSLGHLIHLRYLSVGSSSQTKPPDSRYRPYHLQWLILKRYSPHHVLPAAMKCLVSLRHLNTTVAVENMSENMSGIFENMSGIGKLTHLQELETFRVGTKGEAKIGELKRLNELGGTLRLLSIENVSTKEEALEANLNKKTGIRELELCSFRGHASAQMAEEVFEGLRPPPYIKKLTLDRYNGAKSPSWMVTENHCLAYLQYLCLRFCVYWKVLPPLGELPLLKHLEIIGAYSVEEIGSSFYGSGVAKAFPCLDTLQFTNMRGLALWSGIEIKDMLRPAVCSGGKDTYPFFPHLRELNVTDCPRLKQVPHIPTVEVLKTNSLLMLSQIKHLTSLRHLFIQSSTELVSVPLLPKTLECLHIYSLEKLTVFSIDPEKNPSDLTSLRKIYIDNFPNLRSLPIMPSSLQHLSIENTNTDCLLAETPTSLRELFIEGCPQVSSDLKCLRSLQKLHITSCKSIESVPRLPTTLKYLHISRLDMLTGFSMEQKWNLSDLTSLQYLHISECPRLRFLPTMPASLQQLSIEKCPEVKRMRYEKYGHDWPKVSHVPKISWG